GPGERAPCAIEEPAATVPCLRALRKPIEQQSCRWRPHLHRGSTHDRALECLERRKMTDAHMTIGVARRSDRQGDGMRDTYGEQHCEQHRHDRGRRRDRELEKRCRASLRHREYWRTLRASRFGPDSPLEASLRAHALED